MFRLSFSLRKTVDDTQKWTTDCSFISKRNGPQTFVVALNAAQIDGLVWCVSHCTGRVYSAFNVINIVKKRFYVNEIYDELRTERPCKMIKTTVVPELSVSS